MSYCRWSDMNFGCDIYAYEAAIGFSIHVASFRYKGDVPTLPQLPQPNDKVAIKEWLKAKNKQREFLDTCEREPIGLPHDGKTFTFGKPGEAATMLRELRRCGYRFPDGVLRELDAEQIGLLKKAENAR